MERAIRWTDRTRVGFQLGSIGCCGLLAVTVRTVVDADTLSDSVELALNLATLVMLAAAVALSVCAVRATRAPVPRATIAATSLALIALAAVFIRVTYADVSIELADLIGPADAAEDAAQIVVGPTGEDVRLSGDIKEGAARLLDGLLKAHPSIHRIHLTSEGGLADEGQALADVIAAHRLTTYVSDYCVSACTLAFVGGRERLLMDGARLGFHGPYQQGMLGQTFAGDAKVQRTAYLAAGLSADFVDAALKVTPDDLWIPERDQLLEAHVVTGYVDAYRFPDSMLDGSANGQGARDAVLRNFPILRPIDRAAPQAIDRIAAWYLAAYRRGASEGRTTEDLKRIVGATLTLVLVRADDATLLDLARVLQLAMTTGEPADACRAIGDRVDLVRAEAALQTSDKAADARVEGLVGRALIVGRSVASAVRPAPIASAPRRDTCASLRRIYATALQDHDAAPLRRRLAAAAPDAARVLAPLVAERR